MRKLTATGFTYSMIDSMGYRQIFRGSYLGWKRATRRTLREFVRRNGKEWSPRVISIDNSYITEWIAK